MGKDMFSMTILQQNGVKPHQANMVMDLTNKVMDLANKVMDFIPSFKRGCWS